MRSSNYQDSLWTHYDNTTVILHIRWGMQVFYSHHILCLCLNISLFLRQNDISLQVSQAILTLMISIHKGSDKFIKWYHLISICYTHPSLLWRSLILQNLLRRMPSSRKCRKLINVYQSVKKVINRSTTKKKCRTKQHTP
jgi:hypothetical protein